MMILITYDISLKDPTGSHRLNNIAKHCIDYGIRVQNSVFECDIFPSQWATLKSKLLEIYNPKTDSLRFYYLGSKWHKRVEHYGSKKSIDIFNDTLIL